MKNRSTKKLAVSINVIRLAAVLCSIIFFVLPLVFAKMSPAATRTVYVIAYILWGALEIETIVHFIRMNKEERILYLKMHKGDIAFCLLTLALLPMSIVKQMASLGVVLVLKLSTVLSGFNDEKVFQVIVNILAILLILVFVLPFMNVFAVSLSAPDQIVNLLPKKIDLYSIKYVLADKGFFRAMGISIIVTVVGTTISVLSMSMAAYPLSKPRMPLRRTVMMFFVIVMLFSGGMAPNMLVMNYLGLTNTIWALIFPSVVQVFYLILLKGFFEDIPEELEESAKLDGASNYTILFRIIFPIAAPMIATVTFFTMISYWNNINNSILYITSNQSIYPLPMYVRDFLNRNPMDIAMTNPELMSYWGNVKMSYVLFSIIPVLIVYPFSFKYLKNGVSMGAVKG